MSYTSRQLLPCDNSSVANFNTWGWAISTAIANMGWAMTADSGQVSWPVASVPSGFVYEIWHPTDALQTGSSAFYLKIEYGSGTYPQIRLSLGTGTNGAGTLTGMYTDAQNPYSYPGAYGSNLFECDFCGDTNRLGIFMWRNPLHTEIISFFGVERVKSSSGADSADGVTLISTGGYNTGTTSAQQSILFSIGATPKTRGNAVVSLVSTAIADNKAAVSPFFPLVGGYGNPHTVGMLVGMDDIVDGLVTPLTIYGVAHLYLAAKYCRYNASAGGLSISTMMRFD